MKPSFIVRLIDATDGVEAEDGIGAHDRHAVDRVGRQEVPVDGVAEGLVDAHAVLIDGKPLRQAVDGRSLEAAILDAGLE